MKIVGDYQSDSSDTNETSETAGDLAPCSIGAGLLTRFADGQSEFARERKRQMPHIIGNWASYVSIEIHSQELNSLINDFLEKYPKIDPILNVHVSLSRTHYIKVFQIEKIVDLLANRIRLEKFNLNLSGTSIYFNDDRSRQFLAIDVFNEDDKMLILLEKVDKVLEKFGLEKYYENPKFHFSVGSSAIDFDMKPACTDLHDKILSLSSVHLFVERVLFTSGDRKYYFELT